MKIVITGATGYIGGRLLSIALKRQHLVFVASRRRSAVPEAEWIPFELSSAKPIDLPRQTNAIVHLAANTSSVTDEDGEREVFAAKFLISAAQQVGAKFVFVSSQTARADAPTAYGRIKWQIEQLVLRAGGWVVRPGQVYGGPKQGLFGTIVNVVERAPLLPAFLPSPNIQPIHVDDLADGILKTLESEKIPSGLLCLAEPQPISFTDFLSIIASCRVRRQRYFVPVPIILVKLFTTLLGTNLGKKFGLERLHSLFDLPQMNAENDLQRLDVTLRSLSSGMHPSGDDRRRFLLREAHVLLTYVLKQSPHSTLVCRYVRAIEQLRGGSPLGLPTWTLRWPVALALFDHRTFTLSEKGAEFAWRLDAATVLAEATIQGAGRFLSLGRSSSALISIMGMARAVFAEVVWRILQLFFRRLVRSPWGLR